MSFRVSTAGFEGPFDLLLQLVSRQKVDIGSVSVAQIADQYLAEVARMGELDLEVASDFVLVAATLLDLKAASLVGDDEQPDPELEGEFAGMSAAEVRDVLVARLVAYRQFKGAAASLGARQEAEARTHPRTAGPDPEFLGLLPDYLAEVELEGLARACARFFARRETLLLESEHIAAKRIPLETRVEQVGRTVRARRRLTFEELVADDPAVENRVVSLLALLELNKRRELALEQRELFGTIVIDAVDAPGEPGADR